MRYVEKKHPATTPTIGLPASQTSPSRETSLVVDAMSSASLKLTMEKPQPLARDTIAGPLTFS
eukprot:4372600-Alexandrium_andersonii.AAC.1